jgi:hypothetical protein
MFLRGVNGDRNDQFADPDKNNRRGGNDTGSTQLDEFKVHNHSITAPGEYRDAAWAGGGPKFFLSPVGSSTGNTGGNETRPKNTYVYYLIKY